MTRVAGLIASLQLDDSPNPGSAKVRLIEPVRFVNGYQCWKVEILEVTKPSPYLTIGVGQKFDVTEKHLSNIG